MIYICKKIFGFSYPTFLFILTATSLIIKFSFFQRYFKYPIFLILLYFPSIFLYADFGQIRQGMDVGIFLWAIPAKKNRQLLRFLIIYILACSFHFSSLICFPLYWMYKITVGKKLFWGLFILGFFINKDTIISVIFSSLASEEGGFIGKLIYYMLAYGEASSPLSYFLDINTLLILIVVPFYQYVYRKEIQTRTEKDLEFSAYNIYVLFFLMIKMMDIITVISYRGAYFYKMIEGIIFYYYMNRLKEKEFKLTLMTILFLYGLIRLVFIIQKQEWAYIPYQMFTEFLGM